MDHRYIKLSQDLYLLAGALAEGDEDDMSALSDWAYQLHEVAQELMEDQQQDDFESRYLNLPRSNQQ